mmetsp:Transcript_131064/g.293185  ORF Transcript_131064/g.293185 Transcript_131064/m.293185 type:complete len:226 (+) Transcript_131064:94-771(+)
MPSRVPSSLAIATHRSTSPARGFGCVSLFQNNDRRRDLISVNARLGPRILQAHEGAQRTLCSLGNRPEIRRPFAAVPVKLWEIIWRLAPNRVFSKYRLIMRALARIGVVQAHRARFVGRRLLHKERTASPIQLVAYLGHGLPEDLSPEVGCNRRDARRCNAVVGGIDKKDTRGAGQEREPKASFANFGREPLVVGGMKIEDWHLHLVNPTPKINDRFEAQSRDGM